MYLSMIRKRMAIPEGYVEFRKATGRFEVQKHLNSPSWLHNMRDFVEHTDADWGNQPEGLRVLMSG